MNTSFRRSSTDRLISGVCGGLGRRLGIDTVIVRLIFLSSIFFLCGSALMMIGGQSEIAERLFLLSGFTFCFSPLAYLMLWVVMPKELAAQAFAAPQIAPQPQAPATMPAYNPTRESMTAYNPTREWKFDPYTGQPIEK
jgi:phage shock protein C